VYCDESARENLKLYQRLLDRLMHSSNGGNTSLGLIFDFSVHLEVMRIKVLCILTHLQGWPINSAENCKAGSDKF